MEWWLVLLLILGSFVVLVLAGMPVAFAFFTIVVVAGFFLWHGGVGIRQVVLGIFSSVSSFSLLPIPLFILMGDVLFRAGIAPRMIEALDKWLGRVPGRLGLLAVGSGTIFATMTGSSISSAATLGSVLAPEMRKRGYSKEMSLGPILASGCLAAMIPPSAMAVILASLGNISVAQLLVAIIVPGLLMAGLFAAYIVIRCKLQPSLAPPYTGASFPLSDKMLTTTKYVLPISFIIFLVIGLISLGVATPTEAAALGALGCFLLAAAYQALSWKVIKGSLVGTIKTTGMVLLIIASANVFSQVLAFSGASQNVARLATSSALSPIMMIIVMQLIVLVMGMFLDPVAIMMVTLPIYMPVVRALGMNEVWFGVLFLVNAEIAGITPPFGLVLFAVKGVAPRDVTLRDVYSASVPFCLLEVLALAIIIIFPSVALWLPLMTGT